MLQPRSVAVVGASARPGSFGERLAAEALRSRARVHLVGRSPEVFGRRTVPSLADVEDDVDLVLLGVPDAALVEQLALARTRSAGGAVVFGAAHGLAAAVLAAVEDDLALCGPGCMGFVNPARGVRAIGYVERPQLTPGPLALVTHSGSVFSALLRTHRRLEWSLAVSSGQELVTSTADYLHHALDQPETGVVALVLETMRDVDRLRSGLARAAEQDVSVVALTVGRSAAGSALVAAHSGAVAGAGAAWEALLTAYGVHRVGDLDELVDTLELFALGRRVRRGGAGRRPGIATVHDSGGERALVADLASDAGVPFAEVGAATHARLHAVLDPGLAPGNPLDVWGRGLGTEALFGECLSALADDDAVEVVALAVDLVEEYDGDESYPRAVMRAHAETDKPVAVLAPLAAAVDQSEAGRLRAAGVPVLEGAASGLRALGHLRDAAAPVLLPGRVEVDRERRARWAGRLAGLGDAASYELLADYGLQVAHPRPAADELAVRTAADQLGYPVALKTAALAHKTDAGGVHLGIADAAALRGAYADLATRLGPRVSVQPMVEPGLELALGLVRDPHVGPLVVLAVGGTLVEVVAERVVALPPLDSDRAHRLLDASPVIAQLIAGVRGGPPVDRDAVVSSLIGLGRLAVELGDELEALDVNPLVCHARGAVAVDVLLLAHPQPRGNA